MTITITQADGKTATLDASNVDVNALAALLSGGKPKAKPMPKARKARPQRQHYGIKVDLVDCIGIGYYPTRNGLQMVAIYKEGTNKETGKPWMKLLWVDEENNIAHHDQQGFFCGRDEDGEFKITAVERK